MIRFLAEGGGTPPPTHNNFGDTMSDGMAGPLALLIIVLLAIATALLIRNMNARLRRLPERFPDQPGPSRSAAKPSVPAAEPSVPAAEPSVPAAEPSVAAAEPSVAAAESSVASADPTAPAGPATATGG
jgi:predicted lipid-binding transport protein (Tim44 family)